MRGQATRPSHLHPLLLAAGTALAALLSACGGGGGSGVDAGVPVVPASATITPANYEGVARQTVNAADYLGGSSGLVTGAQVAPGAQALFGFGRTQGLRLGGLFARAPVLATGATSAQTLACSGGGSMNVSVNDANGNSAVDAGDSGTVTASNCVEAGATINGSMTIVFGAVSGTFGGTVFSATMTITMQGLSASSAGGTATGNGSFTMAITQASTTTGTVDMLVPSLTLSGNLGGVTDTITLQDYHLVTSTSAGLSTTTLSGGMGSTAVAGGMVTLSTLQPLVQFDSDTYPSSGQLLAAGANGSKLRMTVQSASSVLLELDANGDGSYETRTTHTWADLI